MPNRAHLSQQLGVEVGELLMCMRILASINVTGHCHWALDPMVFCFFHAPGQIHDCMHITQWGLHGMPQGKVVAFQRGATVMDGNPPESSPHTIRH